MQNKQLHMLLEQIIDYFIYMHMLICSKVNMLGLKYFYPWFPDLVKSN